MWLARRWLACSCWDGWSRPGHGRRQDEVVESLSRLMQERKVAEGVPNHIAILSAEGGDAGYAGQSRSSAPDQRPLHAKC
ncbi:hypothetical protein DL89DRAFT_73012 [Linderina pennispora]|uniref:Uncharacterized protein n=1 Tax=Linderina pennispora TaxID=61395 RepID=A0A1Y1VY29_9FUNG|nr:uncharacterized protein DL89DRAFT_73012 [Linderina pennispora]ORX66188.1 hypothetical protein DL89DRAFT_73012 [Linderina pennispora]